MSQSQLPRIERSFLSMAKGSVRKKGKKWYGRFYIEDESGRKVQKEFAGTESKAETEAMLLCQEIVQNKVRKSRQISKEVDAMESVEKERRLFPHFPQRNDGDWRVRATTIMRIMPQRACTSVQTDPGTCSHNGYESGQYCKKPQCTRRPAYKHDQKNQY